MRKGLITLTISFSFLFAVPLFFVFAAEPQTTVRDGVVVSQTTADILKGGCPSSPHDELMKRYRPGAVSSKEGKDGIMKLNADFACRLSKLLNRFPGVVINSAYRSVASQQVLWNQALAKYGSPEKARKYVAPPGNSMHNKGLAADLGGATAALRAAAGSEGLTFRMGHEPWHIEPSGPVKGGLGDGTGNTPLTPSSPLTSATRSVSDALGLTQPSPQQLPPQQLPPQQTQPSQAQPTNYFPQNPTTPTGPTAPTTPTTPTTPTIPTGPNTPTTPNTPVPTPTGTTSTSTGDGFDVGYIPYQPSVGDKLLELAYGTTKGTGVAATTTKVVVSGTDTTSLGGSPVPTAIIAGSDASVIEMQPPNTFTSPDLAYYGAPSGPDATGFAVTLANLELMIRTMFEVLRPMGISAALAGEPSNSHEHAD